MTALNKKTCLGLASCFLGAAAFFLSSSTAVAKDHNASQKQIGPQINSKVLIGLGSDSNVTVDQIDTDLGVRDSLWSFSADVNYKQKLKPRTELKVGLSHSQDRYENFSEFDLDTNFVTAELTHDFKNVSIGGAIRYITADLDSQSFLSISQASFNASTLLSNKLFLRADYTYADKALNTFSDRDSSKHSLGADLYFFLDGSKRYLVAGYKYQDEDAIAEQFDRKTHNLKLRYKHTFSAFERQIIGRIKAGYRIRDYDAITPSIGVIRDDERFRIGADLKLLLSDSLFVVLEYEYSDYQSNLPAVDYEQDVVALKIGWQFKRKRDSR